MEYFILQQDERVYNTIHIPISRYLNNRDYRNMNLDPLPRMTVIIREGSRYEDYPDLLSSLFLVSENLNEVISCFMPAADYKMFCIWDRQKNTDFYYYSYSPPVIECLSDKSMISGGDTVIERAVLKRDMMQAQDIVRVPGLNIHLILVSLPVAEAILRRNLKGVRLLETYYDE